MLFNESCSKGQLQVTETTVQVVRPLQKVVWSVPRQSVTYIALKKGAVMVDLTIYTASSHFPANFMAPHKAERFLTFFSGIAIGPPITPSQTYVPVTASVSQWPSAPTAPFLMPPPQLAKQKPPRWAYIVTGVLALVLCGCISTAVIAAAAASNSSQGQVASSPTDTPPSAGQSSTLAATVVTGDTPTPAPTPTQKPTARPALPPTPRPTPKPQPTHAPPTPTPCPGINCNPWGYNFTPGNDITSPPSAFCSYFSCINNFWNGHGYVNECQDGEYSLSGGIRGDCSYHGGEARPLYAH